MSKPRILVVEDETIVALDMQKRLTKLGYLVPAIATCKEEAIEESARQYPDLVLMDIRLKGDADGVMAAEEIRTRFDIPVVYLTAHVDERTLQRAKVTAPYGFLLKPLEDRNLHSAIAIALYRHRMEGELKASKQWFTHHPQKYRRRSNCHRYPGGCRVYEPCSRSSGRMAREEAQGKDAREILRIIDTNTETADEHLISQVLQEGIIVEPKDHFLLIAKDGAETPIEISAAPITGDKDDAGGVVVVFRDVTERKQAEAKVRQYTPNCRVERRTGHVCPHRSPRP